MFGKKHAQEFNENRVEDGVPRGDQGIRKINGCIKTETVRQMMNKQNQAAKGLGERYARTAHEHEREGELGKCCPLQWKNPEAEKSSKTNVDVARR